MRKTFLRLRLVALASVLLVQGPLCSVLCQATASAAATEVASEPAESPCHSSRSDRAPRKDVPSAPCDPDEECAGCDGQILAATPGPATASHTAPPLLATPGLRHASAQPVWRRAVRTAQPLRQPPRDLLLLKATLLL